MKRKKSSHKFLLLKAAMMLVISLYAVSADKALADTCSDTKPGFSCLDTTKVTGETGCVSNLCPGTPAAVKCCKPPANAQASTPGTTSANGTTFNNPLKFKTVDQFLSQILGVIQKIIVTLSLVVIAYGSVLYVISAGGDQIKTAKNAITSALVGLAIGIAAPSFLKEIAAILGWGTSDTRLANALSLTQIATNVLNFLLGILGILSLIMLVYGAGMYLTSAGDSGQVETGKKIFKYALLGVFLAMASLVLVTQVAKLFVAA